MKEEKANRIVITITDMDRKYIQTWFCLESAELWEFLNNKCNPGGGAIMRFPEQEEEK